MRKEIILVRDLVNRLNNKDEEFFDFFHTIHSVIAENENVLLVCDDEYDAPDEIDGYTYRLEYGVLKQICDNLNMQISNPTLDDYIEAINYYIENDAFIDKENPYNKPQGGYKIWGMAGTSDKTDI